MDYQYQDCKPKIWNRQEKGAFQKGNRDCNYRSYQWTDIWDDGQHVVLAGDAAGVVAPASGEGIFYAMTCGDMVADTVAQAIEANDPGCLKLARKRFLKKHGKVFWVLGIMQRFWYHSDKRRERFVTMCADADVQRLTWESYLNKKLVRRDPMAHLRIFVKDVGHLLGIVSENGKTTTKRTQP